MTELLIFDFDGVIADSEVVANQVLADCVTELGVATTLEDSYRLYMGKRLPDVMSAIVEQIGCPLPADFPHEFQRRTLERFRSDLKPVPGALNFLSYAATTPKCIASSSSPDRLALCLEILDLTDVFGAAVFSASMVPRGKPNPDIFLHAAREMGVDPEAALVIEDSTQGISAAVAANATAIGLLAASHIQSGDRERLGSAGAHFVAESFAEIENWMQR